jgi:hypothetical protein
MRVLDGFGSKATVWALAYAGAWAAGAGIALHLI